MEWKTPEPRKNAAGGVRENWDEVAVKLATRPGEWAVVARDRAPSLAGYLKKKYPDHEWTARGVGANRRAAEIYGRYVG